MQAKLTSTFSAGAMVCVLISLVVAETAVAKPSASSVCDQAAHIASGETGVPYAVLRAITRTETGRQIAGRLEPWAWAVNVEGAGHWFDSKSAAKSYVNSHLSQGKRSIDIGCFQINIRWHGEAFRSLEDMFDPVTNARYAASFLAKLFKETGVWSEAVGAYHSRTDEHADRYLARYDQVLADLDGVPAANAVTRSAGSGENLFPLLQRNTGNPAPGSLVPLGNTGRRSLLGQTDGRG